MKLSEQQRSRSFFDFVKDHSDFIVKTGFLRNIWLIRSQSSYESYWKMGMKFFTNELGHITKMAAMPIYVKKNFKNLLLQN